MTGVSVRGAGRRAARGSAAGNILTLLLLLGLIGLGAYLWLGKKPAGDVAGKSAQPVSTTTGTTPATTQAPDGDAPDPDRTRRWHADARSRRNVRAERQHAADRHQRIRRLRRPDRRERRPGAECRFVLQQGVRLQGEDHEERKRNLVAAEQRSTRCDRHDGRCTGRAGSTVRCRRAGADRLLARRRHGRRRSWHRLREQSRRQGARGFAVQRKRILHSLPGAGSRRRRGDSARSRLASAGGTARPGVLRRCLRRVRRLSSTNLPARSRV